MRFYDSSLRVEFKLYVLCRVKKTFLTTLVAAVTLLVWCWPCCLFIYLFIYLRRCPGQLARITTNLTAHWTLCKPSGHIKHRGDDRHAHEDSNSRAAEWNKLLPQPCCLFVALVDATWPSADVISNIYSCILYSKFELLLYKENL